jgi:hypothetical protein
MPDSKPIMRELVRHRFILAMTAIITSSAALFLDKMTGAEWNIALAAILTAYGAAAWKGMD